MSEELAMAIVELKRDEVEEAVRSKAEKGENPIQILEECRQGMIIVGERFQKGDAPFHDLRGLQHKRQQNLALAKQIADMPHRRNENIVDRTHAFSSPVRPDCMNAVLDDKSEGRSIRSAGAWLTRCVKRGHTLRRNVSGIESRRGDRARKDRRRSST